jgi:hypothetical protein
MSHALSMLCALGAVVFAASPARKSIGLPSMALGFVLALIWIRSGRLPDAGVIGGAVAFVAALELVRPRHHALAAACGGALTALWASLLEVQGFPRPAAFGVAAIAPILSAYLATRSRAFAPAIVREEALMGLLTFGVVVAMAPTVAEGWRSALALNLVDSSGPTQLVPAWTIGLAAGSVALGGMYSLWRRG